MGPGIPYQYQNKSMFFSWFCDLMNTKPYQFAGGAYRMYMDMKFMDWRRAEESGEYLNGTG